MPLSILLNGARGRMGRAIAEAASATGVVIGAEVDVGDDLAGRVTDCDVIVDFSSPAATRDVLALAARYCKAVVIGTTGHETSEKTEAQILARQIPCVWAGNYSVGVNLLFALTRRAAGTLGEDFDVELVEMHHRFKKDAPSGTAARILEIVKEERRLAADSLRHGRSGMVGARSSSEIGVHAVRGGDVVGDHTVIFAGIGERLELTHKASDRSIFARGALRAAHWIVGRPPGLYDMQDVLGLK